MNSKRDKNIRVFTAVGVVVALILFHLVFFAFQLVVAMKLESFAHMTSRVMMLGFTLWLYMIYRRVKDADEKRERSATSAEVLLDMVALILFVTSGVGYIFPSAQTAACWSNVILSFYLLVTYSISGAGTIKREINLSRLK